MKTQIDQRSSAQICGSVSVYPTLTSSTEMM